MPSYEASHASGEAGPEPVSESERTLLHRYLMKKELVGPGPVSVTRLAGGVSNDVLAVYGDGAALVVKRALGRLRVAEEWLADPARVLTEAAALDFARNSQPGSVPKVLLVDPDELIVVIEHAESGAHEWKTDLLAGYVDPPISTELGRLLGMWHLDSFGDPRVMSGFSSREAFRQLRVEPFYLWVANLHPDLRRTIDDIVTRMLDSRICLIHGDFSPKNMLIGPTTLWVIDWEVAHYGDPAFDLGFLLSHLACKALHMPSKASEYEVLGREFLRAYVASVGDTILLDDGYLAAQTACLLLARMDGKSPVTYLDPPALSQGRAIARSFLNEPDGSLDDLWRALL